MTERLSGSQGSLGGASPSASDAPPGRLRFATARLSTGPRVHYAEQGVARGEPIVFVHG